MSHYRIPSVIANPGEVWYPAKAPIVEINDTWNVIRQQLEAPLRERAWRGTVIELIMPVADHGRERTTGAIFLVHN